MVHDDVDLLTGIFFLFARKRTSNYCQLFQLARSSQRKTEAEADEGERFTKN